MEIDIPEEIKIHNNFKISDLWNITAEGEILWTEEYYIELPCKIYDGF